MNEYAPLPPRTPAPSMLSNRLIVGLLLLLTLAVGFLMADRTVSRRATVEQRVNRGITPRGDLADDEKSTIDLFQKSSLSVVHITTLVNTQTSPFSTHVTQQRSGTGSGFVWDELGHIVTNYHVVAGAKSFLVTFADQRTVEAEHVGEAPHKDLAVLRVRLKPDQLRKISVGESENLLVGQKVFAIGNPFGLDQTLTTGVVSGLGREIRSKTDRPISDVIQTNAAINPGNSGGPLLDSAGRLIGVNTAIYSPTGASAGIGFAIPVDTVRRIVPQLVKNGRVVTPALGITLVSRAMLQSWGLGVKGVLVGDVVRGGPAQQAEMAPSRYSRRREIILGDIIIGIDSEEIRGVDDLYEALERHEVGDRVRVQVVRGADTRDPETKTLDVVLGASEM